MDELKVWRIDYDGFCRHCYRSFKEEEGLYKIAETILCFECAKDIRDALNRLIENGEYEV
ncbi:hypothetical protein [Bacillus sp. OTU530]|uniref:hypothetical protein n=1 Tax=Bacillus sp. OTU530 TaxID=3043862 RepID=UPI00313C75E0